MTFTNNATVAPATNNTANTDWRAALKAMTARGRSQAVQAALAAAAKAEAEARAKAKAAKKAKPKAKAAVAVAVESHTPSTWEVRRANRAQRQALADLLAAHPWLRDTLWYAEGAVMAPVATPEAGTGNDWVRKVDPEKASGQLVQEVLKEAVPVWWADKAEARAKARANARAAKADKARKAAEDAEKAAENAEKNATRLRALADEAKAAAHAISDEERQEAQRQKEAEDKRKKEEAALTMAQIMERVNKARDAMREALGQLEIRKQEARDRFKEATEEVQKELLKALEAARNGLKDAQEALKAGEVLLASRQPLSLVEMVARFNRRHTLCQA